MTRRMRAVIVMLLTSAVAAILCVPGSRFTLAQSNAQEAPYDVVIRNGHIIDGTGSPWYAGDIGIRAGRIAAIGNLSQARAKQVMDARGRVVAPGFIDMLGQSELAMLADPHLPSKIFQGITTEITGEGDTVAPQSDATLADFTQEFEHYGI